jgi:hypothetical protein
MGVAGKKAENIKIIGFYSKKFFTDFSGSGILRFIQGCGEGRLKPEKEV